MSPRLRRCPMSIKIPVRKNLKIRATLAANPELTPAQAARQVGAHPGYARKALASLGVRPKRKVPPAER